MDYHVARVDQHPIAQGNAFDTRIADPGKFEFLEKLIGNRTDMTLRPAGRYNHRVPKGRFACQVYRYDIFGFRILQRVINERRNKIRSVRRGWVAMRFPLGEVSVECIRFQLENLS